MGGHEHTKNFKDHYLLDPEDEQSILEGIIAGSLAANQEFREGPYDREEIPPGAEQEFTQLYRASQMCFP